MSDPSMIGFASTDKIYYLILVLFGNLNGLAYGMSFILLLNNDLNNYNFVIYTTIVFILWLILGKKLVLRIYENE